MKVVKNKVAAPFKVAQFGIMYNNGINRAAKVLDLAVAGGLIQKAGAWHSMNDQKIEHGKENVCKCLQERPDVMAELTAVVMSSVIADQSDRNSYTDEAGYFESEGCSAE